MTCPSCTQALSERGAFCKWCGAQARCTHCKELLEPEAKACVECGTIVGNTKGNSTTAPNQRVTPTGLPANRNTIRFREDRNSRDWEASLSDSSVHSLGGVLGELFARGKTTQPGANRFFTREGATVEILQPQLSAPEHAEQAATAAASPTQAPPAPAEHPELTRISSIFQPNGEALELVDNRLKATTGMDYVRRLTYLFLFAHELHGRAWTPKDALITVLKDAKVWDGNSRYWLGKKNGFRIDSENKLQLNQGSREEARKTLNEVLDASVKDAWNPDTKTVTKRGPRKKKSS